MKSLLPRWALALVSVFFALSLSCRAAATDPREADHEALRALRDRLVVAMGKQDMKEIRACFAKDFAFTTVTQELITGEAQLAAFYEKMFNPNTGIVSSMKSEPQADILTRFVDGNTGICHGTAKDTYTMKSGEVVTMQLRWSATVVKEDGAWKIAVAHVGTNFIENPVIDRVVRGARRFGLFGLIAGALTGFAIGWLVFRRKSAAAA